MKQVTHLDQEACNQDYQRAQNGYLAHFQQVLVAK